LLQYVYPFLGWNQGTVNYLEIYEGVTSQGNILARYTTENVTSGDVHFSAGDGLYIRLRGVFNMADRLKLVFTGVTRFHGNLNTLHLTFID